MKHKAELQRPVTPLQAISVAGQEVLESGRRGKGLPSSSRYRLGRCIASGGMGAVYLGVQRGAAGFERPVAIKRTHAHLLGTPERRQLMLQEARNAAAVRHPNVVGIDDVEEVEDELLLVMPYIDGSSLSQLVKAGRAPLGVVVSVIRDACAGLHAIHVAADPMGRPLKLLHRDISPQNVLIGFDGMARIIDFGIAKSARDPSRTSKNDRRGKFGYMSPEYIALGTSTQAGDVYAMGVVLWEALAGRRLFPNDTLSAALERTVDATIPLLRPGDERVTDALDAVLQKALAREPADRFQTAAELSLALDDALPNLVVSRSDVAAIVSGLDNLRPSIVHPRPSTESIRPGSNANAITAPDGAGKVVDDNTKPVPPSEVYARLSAEDSKAMTRRHHAFELPEGAAAEASTPALGATIPRPTMPSEPAQPRVPAEFSSASPSAEKDAPPPSSTLFWVPATLTRNRLLACVAVLFALTLGLTYACIATYADRHAERHAVATDGKSNQVVAPSSAQPVGSAVRRQAAPREVQRPQ